MNCEQRESVIFNGTMPGPPLYLKEGETTWVRVYNDMSDLNFTVVCNRYPIKILVYVRL